MLQRVAHIVLSLTLSVLLLFGSTAKEFVHLFASHEDTSHCNTIKEGDGLVFESEHHHCTFLSFALPAFHQDHQQVYLPVVLEAEYPLQFFSFHTNLIQREVVHTSLRGPPSLPLTPSSRGGSVA